MWPDKRIARFMDAKAAHTPGRRSRRWVMFSSRMFIALLIPLIILALGAWLSVVNEADRSDVKVAGALVGKADVEFNVRECRLEEKGGSRTLLIDLEVRNVGETEVNVNPLLFQVALSSNSDPLAASSPNAVYQPMSFTSTCPEAPGSVSLVPASATRHISLSFWGQNLPRGREWDDYLASLDYYDPANTLILSTAIRPEEK